MTSRYCVLNFHGIGTPKRPLDDGEEPYWISADFFSGIMAHIASKSSALRPEITFDDGNKSDIEIAAPILKRHGLTAEFFVLAGRLDSPGSLSRADVKQLQADGMRIGSHGYDHVDWKKLDAAGQKREWVDARQAIEQVTGTIIDCAAIPFGSYDGKVVTGLRAQKYRRIATSDRGLANRDSPVIPRTSVKGAMQMADIEKILTDDFSFAVKARRQVGNLKRKWLE